MNIYETHTFKNPQLPFIYHPDFTILPGYVSKHPNWHENVEILSVTGGAGTITSDMEHLAVVAGDTVVINANCLHSFSANKEESLSYRCLIVDRRFCLENHFDTNTIRFDTKFRDGEIDRLFAQLHTEYTPPFRNEYRNQAIRALGLQMMARLCREYSTVSNEKATNSYLLSAIKQAIGYIRTHSEKDLSLDEISGLVGLSKFYFARAFHSITGYTFVSYINLVRCENAKRLLAKKEMSIGEVGRACGFENQSYFSRTFQSYTGQLPSEYRNAQADLA